MELIVSLGNLVVSLLDLTICVDAVLPSCIYHCYVQMLSRIVSLYTSSEETVVDLNISYNDGQKCLGHSLEFKTRRAKFCFLLKGMILMCFPTSSPLPFPPKCEKYSGHMGSTLGNLSNHDGNAKENVTLKITSKYFKLFRDSFNSFNLSNVAE